MCTLEKRPAVVPAVLELAGLSATPPDCGSSTLRTHPALKCMYAVVFNVVCSIYYLRYTLTPFTMTDLIVVYRGPVQVLVMSLLFIASVFMLHIWGKYTRA